MSATPADIPVSPSSLGEPRPRPSQSVPASEKWTYAAAIAAFALSAVITLYLCHSMSGGMPMPGHWNMSMMWMKMPGQKWIIAALAFLGMWLFMMVAMMLPSSLPLLLVYRRASAFRGEKRLGLLTFMLGTGYFFVWVLFGAVAYAQDWRSRMPPCNGPASAGSSHSPREWLSSWREFSSSHRGRQLA